MRTSAETAGLRRTLLERERIELRLARLRRRALAVRRRRAWALAERVVAAFGEDDDLDRLVTRIDAALAMLAADDRAAAPATAARPDPSAAVPSPTPAARRTLARLVERLLETGLERIDPAALAGALDAAAAPPTDAGAGRG